jgi:hypothetical protein
VKETETDIMTERERERDRQRIAPVLMSQISHTNQCDEQRVGKYRLKETDRQTDRQTNKFN